VAEDPIGHSMAAARVNICTLPLCFDCMLVRALDGMDAVPWQ
jgi:hypothetical protein